MNKKNNRKGFTTVELVIVIAVIAILATALIPTFGGLISKANETADARTAENIYKQYLAEANNVADVIDATYYIEVNGKYFLVNEGSLDTETPKTVETKTPCYNVIALDDNGEINTTNGDAHVDNTDPKDGKCDVCKGPMA